MELDLPLVVTLGLGIVILGYCLYKWISVKNKRRHRFGISLDSVTRPKHIWQPSMREGILYCNVSYFLK